MKIEFFDIDEHCKNLAAVTSNKIYAKRGFHEDGLFSQKIFGPIRNYSCACGDYHGRAKAGQLCSICGVEITNSNVRRKRFAKIELPFPIMNPIMYYLLIKVGKITFKDILDNLLLSDMPMSYRYDEKLKKYIRIAEDEVVPEGTKIFSGLEGAHEISKKMVDENKDKSKIWRYIYDNFNKFYMNNAIVMPPAFRPISKTRDVQKRDKMNDFLLKILNFTLTKNQELLNTNKDSGISFVNVKNLQRYIFDLYEYIISKFGKKQGLIRDSILGKRNDFSGRAVIAPDPTLNLDECGVPYLMLLELYKLEISNILNERRLFKTYDKAVTYIDECMTKHDYALYDLVGEICTGRYVILNRQPTLHRMGILAFKIKVNKEMVIQLHPMACEPFNADFDGDQMAIYRALYPEAEKECAEKLSISKNLLSPSTGDLILGVNQDIVLGLYLLTIAKETEKTDYIYPDGEKLPTYKGRIRFNECLPKGYKFWNETMTKNLLMAILNDLARTYDSSIVAKTLDNIKRLGFETTTKYGSTISLKGMIFTEASKITSKIFDDKTLTINDQIEKLKSPEIMAEVRKNFGYSVFIDSGSRGSWDQARQIILSRGYVSNSDGKIVETPVRNNFVHGLTREEFFVSSYGTRKGLLDTALNTGVSGYLTRKTVFGTANLELDDDVQDCGTKDTLNINILDLKMARALIGRFNVTTENVLEEVTWENYSKYIGQMVRLRSPILCQSKKLCKTCYGKTAAFVHSKYVGIMASQALGEVGTQLVMRTFHTSGVALTSKKSAGQEDIISDLTRVRELLHANKLMSYDQLVIELYKIYSRHKIVLMVHFECVVAQMMRVGKLRWRLLENRHEVSPEIVSVLSIPQRESWLLALAFHKPKDFIIDGILNESDTKEIGVLEKIMTNRRI
jgi:DNA-directed RNA polymerase subunit beta'